MLVKIHPIGTGLKIHPGTENLPGQGREDACAHTHGPAHAHTCTSAPAHAYIRAYLMRANTGSKKNEKKLNIFLHL